MITDFANGNNNTALSKFKQKITDQTGAGSTKDVEIMVPFKYLSEFWGTFQMPFINCEINFILTWSANFVVSSSGANKAATFLITDTQIYVLVVTLSAQDNAKLLQYLKLDFKRTINWNKHQSKVTIRRQNKYLDYLIDPCFQGVNVL